MTISLKYNDSFALYSLPGDQNHFLLKQRDSGYTYLDQQTFDQNGFVLYPFDRTKESPGIFIRNEVLIPNATIQFHAHHSKEVTSISKEDYLKNVREFIAATNDNFQKIIYSRVKVIHVESGNLMELFEALKNAYPNAFVYLVNIDGIGCWIGASPEILYSQNGLAHTMALAGTQKDLGLPLNEVNWNRKDVEEQAIVERYFQKILTKRKIPYDKTAPNTVRAGNILHLRTDFLFNPQGKVFELISDLHPSPAVCGMPKETAKKFILSHEPHPRAYYCGFLGPVNVHRETNLFVNLRCMQVFKDKFALYVGGGILPDSDPEKEWEETEIKARTLANVIETVYLYDHAI